MSMSHQQTLEISYETVVQELIEMIRLNGWDPLFSQAVQSAHDSNAIEMEHIRTVGDFLQYLNDLLRWVPGENSTARKFHELLGRFHFVLLQPPVYQLQNALEPADAAPALTPLSAWMVRYAQEVGKFMDTPESITAESLASFRNTPEFHMEDYLEPRGGWRTFNEMFARSFKPGHRPIAAIADPTVIVSAADSTFQGQWEIDANACITVKGISWKISELLEGSPYKDSFSNGTFMHAFLGANDYHRVHTPLNGTVVEARVISGQIYVEVTAVPIDEDAVPGEGKRLRTAPTFAVPNTPGYQFTQTRGLIMLDTPIGLVAVIPVGMSMVSSVVLTAELGVTLRKGEELAYFQFGGSDIVLLFQSRSNVSLQAQVDAHYKVGTAIGKAYPVVIRM